MNQRQMGRQCHMGVGLGSAALVADPDLLSLRSAAMREKEAFLTYRHHGIAIADRRLADIFHQEALHEASHFIDLNRMIARLDPQQADEFRHHDLAFLVGATEEDPQMRPHGQEMKVKDPEMWLADVKEAIDLEYHTLNAYQEEASQAIHPEVKELFTRIMNHEKEDVAIFIRELYRLLHHR